MSYNLAIAPDLLERLDVKAQQTGETRNVLIVRLIEAALNMDGLKRLELSTSEIACLDQLAERRGVTRVELMRTWLSQRLRREFVDARNAKLQDLASDSPAGRALSAGPRRSSIRNGS